MKYRMSKVDFLDMYVITRSDGVTINGKKTKGATERLIEKDKKNPIKKPRNNIGAKEFNRVFMGG
mgnify:CR=1 FL=1